MPKRAAIPPLLLGGFLVALAAPHFLASLVAMPGDAVLADIDSGGPIDPHILDVLIASRRSVLALISSARAESDLGYALLLEAQGTGDPEPAKAAIDILQHSLGDAPARPYAWTRLAYALMLTQGPSAAVADALHMAIETAPEYGPPYDGLLISRVTLCLLALPYFSESDRAIVYAQLRLAWWREQHETIRVVLAINKRGELAEALRDYPNDMNELRRLHLL